MVLEDKVDSNTIDYVEYKLGNLGGGERKSPFLHYTVLKILEEILPNLHSHKKIESPCLINTSEASRMHILVNDAYY